MSKSTDINGKIFLSVREFCAWSGVGSSTFYNLVSAKKIKISKIGRKTVVHADDALLWAESVKGN